MEIYKGLLSEEQLTILQRLGTVLTVDTKKHDTETIHCNLKTKEPGIVIRRG